MAKLRVSFLDNLKKNEEYILSSLATAAPDVNITNIHIATSHAIIAISSYNDISKLLSQSTTDRLIAQKLQVHPPPSYLPSRSIFINKVLPFITDYSNEEILRNINECIKNPIKAWKAIVVKHRNHTEGDLKSLKIIFNNPEEADKVLSQGIFVGGLQFSPDRINKETYISLKQCFRCFQYTHYANECKEKKGLCSICSLTHHYRNCPNKNSPYCILCKGNHHATSPACPIRREEIKKAAQAPNNPPQTSTAAAAASYPPEYNILNDNFPPLPQSRPIQQLSAPFAAPPTVNTASTEAENRDTRLKVYQGMADRLAGEDNAAYCLLMNDFLKQNGIMEIDVSRMLSVLREANTPRNEDAPVAPPPGFPPINNDVQQESSSPIPPGQQQPHSPSSTDDSNLEISVGSLSHPPPLPSQTPLQSTTQRQSDSIPPLQISESPSHSGSVYSHSHAVSISPQYSNPSSRVNIPQENAPNNVVQAPCSFQGILNSLGSPMQNTNDIFITQRTPHSNPTASNYNLRSTNSNSNSSFPHSSSKSAY